MLLPAFPLFFKTRRKKEKGEQKGIKRDEGVFPWRSCTREEKQANLNVMER